MVPNGDRKDKVVLIIVLIIMLLFMTLLSLLIKYILSQNNVFTVLSPFDPTFLPYSHYVHTSFKNLLHNQHYFFMFSLYTLTIDS